MSLSEDQIWRRIPPMLYGDKIVPQNFSSVKDEIESLRRGIQRATDAEGEIQSLTKTIKRLRKLLVKSLQEENELEEQIEKIDILLQEGMGNKKAQAIANQIANTGSDIPFKSSWPENVIPTVNYAWKVREIPEGLTMEELMAHYKSLWKEESFQRLDLSFREEQLEWKRACLKIALELFHLGEPVSDLDSASPARRPWSCRHLPNKYWVIDTYRNVELENPSMSKASVREEVINLYRLHFEAEFEVLFPKTRGASEISESIIRAYLGEK